MSRSSRRNLFNEITVPYYSLFSFGLVALLSKEKDTIIVKFNKRHCIIDKVCYCISHKSHAFEELLPFFRAGL